VCIGVWHREGGGGPVGGPRGVLGVKDTPLEETSHVGRPDG
jgi:hypothetical protein